MFIALGAILVPVLIYLVGLTPAGVALGAFSRFLHSSRSLLLKNPSEGSLAAAWHSSIGSVAAGSVFAILQSLRTTLALLEIIRALISGFGCVIHSIWEYLWGEDRGSEKEKAA
jgi:hypothetical protein